MKKYFIILFLVMSIGLLVGCQKPAEEATEPIEQVDPLAEAREELFSEIGIEDGEIKKKGGEEIEIPDVLPTPPSLPETDVDLGDLPLE